MSIGSARHKLRVGLVGSVLAVAPLADIHAQSRVVPGAGPSVIQAIEIRRVAVFDSVEARFWPYRVANALHVETRPYVVRRELLFEAGEPYDTAKVNESERNLRALGVFRDVVIDTVRTDAGLVVRVTTSDAWTTTPNFDIASSGSQTIISLSLQESNLLGTRTAALLAYVNDPDRSSVLMAFDSPRAFANRVGIGASYQDRSDGRAGGASLRYPFFSLASRFGMSLGGQFVDGRVLRFVGGDPRPADSLRRQFSIVRTDAAMALAASSQGYVRLGVLGQIRREDFGPEEGSHDLPRTITAVVGSHVTVRAPRYIRMRNVSSMDRIEDIDLGFRGSVTVMAAPSAWGYARNGIGTSVTSGIGAKLPAGFFFTQGSVGGLFTSEGTDSSRADGSMLLVMQPIPRLLVVGQVGGAILRNPAPGGEFDMGLNYGLRAFPVHSFTGDRRILMNVETRWLLSERLFGLLGVGVAGFLDHGGAWYHGSPKRTGTNAGVGLRLASIREMGSVWRIDLARRFDSDRLPSELVFSVGRGFLF